MAASPCGAVGWTNTGSAPVDLLPHRCESGIGEIAAGDIAEHHHTDGAGLDRTIELGDGQLGVLPRQCRERANAVGVGDLCGGHLVVAKLCGA